MLADCGNVAAVDGADASVDPPWDDPTPAPPDDPAEPDDAGATIDAMSSDAAPLPPVVDLDLYMSPSGSDGNDGRAATRPVATLARAYAIVASLHPTGNVRVVVAPGSYRCAGLAPKTLWTYFGAKSVVIAPATLPKSPASTSATDPARPVFFGHDAKGGLCSNSIWMVIRHGDVPVNITVQGIALQGYRGGFSIANLSLTPGKVDQNITLDNMVFAEIGDKYYRPANYRPIPDAGKGVLLLQNTRGNRVTASLFRNVDNQDPPPELDAGHSEGLIHALYFTGYASKITVDHNVFDHGTGAAIKLTNYSNDNVIQDNSFSTFPAAVVDRFCGAGSTPDDVKCRNQDAGPQCPSWENDFYQSRNTFSAVPSHYSVWGIPPGQKCAFPPYPSGVRMWIDPKVPVK